MFLRELANLVRFRVDFIVAGVQKGGTTALAQFLAAHPEICMAKKVPHFFDRGNHGKLARPLRRYAYHRLFKALPSHKVFGEVTPIYMYWLDAPRRIWEYNPRMKLIVLLRNPIDRAYSHWRMECQKKRETLPFEEAIRQEKERCRSALPEQHRVYSYVDRGYYAEQVKRLLHFFPRDQLLALKSEDLLRQHDRCLATVFQFLGVDDSFTCQQQIVHQGQYDQPIAARTRGALIATYRHDIRQLESLLDLDCSNWLTQSQDISKAQTASV